jgi:hypothetical protein
LVGDVDGAPIGYVSRRAPTRSFTDFECYKASCSVLLSLLDLAGLVVE